jgi:hypothetical protein
MQHDLTPKFSVSEATANISQFVPQWKSVVEKRHRPDLGVNKLLSYQMNLGKPRSLVMTLQYQDIHTMWRLRFKLLVLLMYESMQHPGWNSDKVEKPIFVWLL